MFNGPLLNFEAPYSLYECVAWPYLPKWPINLLVLSGAQKNDGLYNRSWLLCVLFCQLGHIIQLIQWCLKSQWQIRMLFEARSLHMNQSANPQNFEAKACHNSPFENLCLNSYWALVETEYLAMDHQVNMWPELPIMNLMHLTQSIQLDIYSSPLSSNRNGMYKIRYKQGRL